MGGKFGKNSMSHKKIHPTRAMMMEDDDDDDDDFYVRYYVVRHVFRSRGGGFFKTTLALLGVSALLVASSWGEDLSLIPMMMMMMMMMMIKTIGCLKLPAFFLRASTRPLTNESCSLRSAMIDDRATRASSGTSFSSLSLNRTGNYDTQTIVTIKETNASEGDVRVESR